jgi:hypothetical protein
VFDKILYDRGEGFVDGKCGVHALKKYLDIVNILCCIQFPNQLFPKDACIGMNGVGKKALRKPNAKLVVHRRDIEKRIIACVLPTSHIPLVC